MNEVLTLAKALAAAVSAVPGVARLSAGPSGVVATYGPGERVEGIVLDPLPQALHVTVRVIARYDPTIFLPDLADMIRGVVRTTLEQSGVLSVPMGTVDVYIDDLVLEGDE